MKTLKTLFILSLLLLNFSCNKDDNEAGTENQPTFYMTAKVDGQDFTANQDATLTEFVGIENGVRIEGVYQIDIDNYEHIRFRIEGYNDSLGTFYFSTNATSITYQINSAAWSAQHNYGSGSVVITVNDNTHIEGTFSGTLIDPTDNTQKVITEGKFNAKKL